MFEVKFDGCCEPRNPGGHMGFAATVHSKEHGLIKLHGGALAAVGNTNNVAEYRALELALDWLIEQGLTVHPVLRSTAIPSWSLAKCSVRGGSSTEPMPRPPGGCRTSCSSSRPSMVNGCRASRTGGRMNCPAAFSIRSLQAQPMRDVAQSPPVLEGPPWEDADAVAKWVLAAMAEGGEEGPSERVGDATVIVEGRVKWREGASYDRWREIAFEKAKEGDFDVLMQFIAFRPDQVSIDRTFEQRKILTDIVAGKIRRRKARPREWPPLYYDVHSPEDAAFAALVARVDRIRSLLGRHYGHQKGILARSASIAGAQGKLHERVLEHFRRHGGNC